MNQDTKSTAAFTSRECTLLSSGTCNSCKGRGLTDATTICDCVWLGVFRTVWQRYKELKWSDRRGSALYMHSVYGVSRPTEEFVADVELMSKRVLDGRPDLQIIYKFHLQMECEPRLLMRQLALKPYQVYSRIAECKVSLGRVFGSTRPYALFPLDDYFKSHHTADVRSGRITTQERFTPVRPPLAFQISTERAA